MKDIHVALVIAIILSLIIIYIYKPKVRKNNGNQNQSESRVNAGECIGDSDCPGSSICEQGICVPGPAPEPVIPEPEEPEEPPVPEPTCDCLFTDTQTVLPTPPNNINFRCLAEDPDGSFYLLYISFISPNYFYYIAKHDANGNLNTNYGTNGFLSIDVPPNFSNVFTKLQDGSFILMKYNYPYDKYRILPNGTLDSTFGTSGVLPEISGMATILMNNPRPDTKFFTAGRNNVTFTTHIRKYHETGQLDTTFANNGLFTIDLLATFSRTDVAVYRLQEMSDGSILIAFGLDSGDVGVMLMRLLANGTYDATFGTNSGYTMLTESNSNYPTSTNLYGLQMEILQDESVLIGFWHYDGGSGNESIGIVKFTPNGLVDTSYGTNGFYYLTAGDTEMESYTSIQLFGMNQDDCGGVFINGYMYSPNGTYILHVDQNGVTKTGYPIFSPGDTDYFYSQESRNAILSADDTKYFLNRGSLTGTKIYTC